MGAMAARPWTVVLERGRNISTRPCEGALESYRHEAIFSGHHSHLERRRTPSLSYAIPATGVKRLRWDYNRKCERTHPESPRQRRRRFATRDRRDDRAGADCGEWKSG